MGAGWNPAPTDDRKFNDRVAVVSGKDDRHLTVFLCGDVMTGRGIDQILPHPSDPRIYEEVVSDAPAHVQLAEKANGPVPHPVDPSYVWGDAFTEFEHAVPDARIINLETSVTRSGEPCPKGINYRMHLENVGCLTSASIDVCALANNHVRDYGDAGLVETLETLERAARGLREPGERLRKLAGPPSSTCRGIRESSFMLSAASRAAFLRVGPQPTSTSA